MGRSETIGGIRSRGGRQHRLPPTVRPNVVLIVLDDVGFAQLGCYGSDIDTPVLDGLAAEGIRLTNFHTTALCSPTRACLLTGRNHHRSGMGRVADLAIGFPGYWGKPPRENGFLSEILRANGYATYAVGKWHLSPEDETNMAGVARHLAARVGGSTGGTASTAARRTSSCRPSTTTTTRVRPPSFGRGGLPPERRPRRPRHRVPGRPAGRRRRQAVLPLLLHRRLPLAAPRASRVDRALPGPLRPGLGSAGARRPTPASSSSGSSPRTPSSRPARRGSRPGTASMSGSG